MGYIYLIKNIKNGKTYIGQTAATVSYRWCHHRCDLRFNTHHNKHLQLDWNRYGESSFICKELKSVPDDELDERERYWISVYDSCNTGYDIATGGMDGFRFFHDDSEIEKMRRIQAPEIVLQFDENFRLVKEWTGGISHISKELGYTLECLRLRCTHKIKYMSPYKDSYWIYKSEYESESFSWDRYLKNEKAVEIAKKESRNIQRPILQYDLSRRLVKKWKCLADIRKEYGNTSSISSVLNRSRGKRTAYGYIWTYEGYDFSDGYFNLGERLRISNNRRCKTIYKIDPETMEIIESFDSLTSASKSVGIDCACISYAAKGYPNRKCKKYLWKYAK